MYQRILIAIDDGAPATCAVDAAKELIRPQTQVALVHVIDVNLTLRPELGIVDEAKLADLRQRGQVLLDRAVMLLDRLQIAERFLIEGDPAEAIINAAEEWKANVIVIGSDSRGRLAHFLLGSTADAVIRRAPCPVLTVRLQGSTIRQPAVTGAVINA